MAGPLTINDWKKEYSFLWQMMYVPGVTIPKESMAKLNGITSFTESITIASLGNVPAMYVSQLAESINLPDDEVEFDKYAIGTVDYPVAKKIKMNPITVTYLDDNSNSVYNFHKIWMKQIKSEGMNFNPMTSVCMSGFYISTDKVFSAAEYQTMQSHLTDAEFIHANGVQVFPRIFPVRISRGTMSKSGTGLSKITVTYERLPVLKNNWSLEII